MEVDFNRRCCVQRAALLDEVGGNGTAEIAGFGEIPDAAVNGGVGIKEAGFDEVEFYALFLSAERVIWALESKRLDGTEVEPGKASLSYVWRVGLPGWSWSWIRIVPRSLSWRPRMIVVHGWVSIRQDPASSVDDADCGLQ